MDKSCWQKHSMIFDKEEEKIWNKLYLLALGQSEFPLPGI